MSHGSTLLLRRLTAGTTSSSHSIFIPVWSKTPGSRHQSTRSNLFYTSFRFFLNFLLVYFKIIGLTNQERLKRHTRPHVVSCWHRNITHRPDPSKNPMPFGTLQRQRFWVTHQHHSFFKNEVTKFRFQAPATRHILNILSMVSSLRQAMLCCHW